MITRIVIASLLVSRIALAQEPSTSPPGAPPAPQQQGEPDRVFSLTWSPLHLILPVVELTGEFKPMPHFGVSVIAGVGSVTDSMTKVSGRALEGGGQINWYPLRDFAGLDFGVEALYLSIDNVNLDSSATAAGLAIGPFIGYKAMFPFGLTLVAQLGVEFVAAKAQSSSAMADQKDVIPLLNLNAGWSF